MMNPENRPTSRDHWSMSLGVILALALAVPAQHQHGQAGGVREPMGGRLFGDIARHLYFILNIAMCQVRD